MSRRRTQMLTTLAVVSIATALLAAPPAHAQVNFDWKAHQFNIWGNVGWGGTGQTSADLVVFLVAASDPKPMSVSTEEVCSDQYLRLQDDLGDLGYVAIRTITVNVGGSCGYYGNAMFLLGSKVTDATFVPPNLEVEYAQQSGELRKFECQRMTTLIGPYTACTTHLAPASVYVNQSAELRSTMDYLYPNDRRLAAGDWNYTNPSGWPTNYWDIDPTGSFTFTASSPSSRIDYAWGVKTNFPSARSGGAYCSQAYSDHCYAWIPAVVATVGSGGGQ